VGLYVFWEYSLILGSGGRGRITLPGLAGKSDWRKKGDPGISSDELEMELPTTWFQHPWIVILINSCCLFLPFSFLGTNDDDEDDADGFCQQLLERAVWPCGKTRGIGIPKNSDSPSSLALFQVGFESRMRKRESSKGKPAKEGRGGKLRSIFSNWRIWARRIRSLVYNQGTLRCVRRKGQQQHIMELKMESRIKTSRFPLRLVSRSLCSWLVTFYDTTPGLCVWVGSSSFK